MSQSSNFVRRSRAWYQSVRTETSIEAYTADPSILRGRVARGAAFGSTLTRFRARVVAVGDSRAAHASGPPSAGAERRARASGIVNDRVPAGRARALGVVASTRRTSPLPAALTRHARPTSASTRAAAGIRAGQWRN